MTTNSRQHYVKLYQSLNLSDDATIEDVNRNYRVLASQLHPDRIHGDSELAAESDIQLRHINEIVRELRQYYKDAGRLPLENADLSAFKEKFVASHQQTHLHNPEDTAIPEDSRGQRWLRFAIFIVVSWSIYLLWTN